MQKTSDQYNAGLVFLSSQSFDVIRMGSEMAQKIEDFGHRILGIKIKANHLVEVQTAEFAVSIGAYMRSNQEGETGFERMPPLSDTQELDLCGVETVLQICLFSSETGQEIDHTVHKPVLITLAYDYAQNLDADVIQWGESNGTLTAQAALDQLSGSREWATGVKVTTAPKARGSRSETRRQEALPEIDQVAGNLVTAFDAHQLAFAVGQGAIRSSGMGHGTMKDEPPLVAEPLSTKMRATIWVLTVALAILALPLAIAVFIFRLARSREQRWATQIAAASVITISIQYVASIPKAMGSFFG